MPSSSNGTGQTIKWELRKILEAMDSEWREAGDIAERTGFSNQLVFQTIRQGGKGLIQKKKVEKKAAKPEKEPKKPTEEKPKEKEESKEQPKEEVKTGGGEGKE